MFQKSFRKIGITSKTAQAFADLFCHFSGIVWAEVGESGGVQPTPQAFHRIQFRSIRGEPFHLQPRSLFLQIQPEVAAAVRRQPVPQQHHRATQVRPHGAQGVHNVFAFHRPEGEGEQDPTALQVRGDGHGSQGGEMLPVRITFAQDWSLPSRPPRGANAGTCGKTALIPENQRGASLYRPFFMRGHSSSNQRAIAASSLSLACRPGRWVVHPSRRRRYQTCPG
jgi:hypothetical protein